MERFPLSRGALLSIMRGESVEDPVIQVLSTRAKSAEGITRVRLLLSDGKYSTSYAMLNINSYRTFNGNLTDNTIIKIKQYNAERFLDPEKNKRVLIILQLEVLLSGEETTKIGNPKQLACNVKEEIEEADTSDVESSNGYPLHAPTIPLPKTEIKEEDQEVVSSSYNGPSHSNASTIPLALNGIKEENVGPSRDNTETDDHDIQNLIDKLEDSIRHEIVENMDALDPSTSSNDNISHNNSFLDVSLQEYTILPICRLYPGQSKFVLKARIVDKSTIRHWQNARGSGKLFSMSLMDESGEIRCTVFNDLVDKFYDTIEVDKVYYIRKCDIKPAGRFNLANNQFELAFNKATVVECIEDDDDESVPKIQFDFCDIRDVVDRNVGSDVDVIGVCTNVSDLQNIQSRNTGTELKKREICLVDQTHAVTVTLWNEIAEKFDHTTHPIVAIKRAKVTEFGGAKHLSVYTTSILKIDPVDGTGRGACLRSWFVNDYEREKDNILNISSGSDVIRADLPWMTLREVQEQQFQDNNERGRYFKTKVTLLLFRSENCLYKACPDENCNKKVIDLGNGLYQCEKCNQNYPNFKYRLLGNVDVGDYTDGHKICMFNSEAEKVLKMTSTEVGKLAERNLSALGDIADRAGFKQFIMECCVKIDCFRDELRLKTVAVKVQNINYKEYNGHLISKIEDLLKN